MLTPEVINKLSLGPLHYKKIPQGQQKDDLSKAKWAGKMAISNIMRGDLIEPLASKLNLDLYVAFELIDAYFTFNAPDFTYLTTLEAKYSVKILK